MKMIATVRRAACGVRRWWMASITIAISAMGNTVPAASIDVAVSFERAAPPAVLVWIPDVSGWKPSAPTVVDQRFEAFHPTIAVAPPGGVVEFINSDNQRHNVFALDAERGIDTDLGLGAPGMTLSLTVSWPIGSVVKHGCKIHPQMQLWIMALDSPLHGVGELPAGTLEVTVRISQVPADTKQVTLWAPRCETVTSTIEAEPTLILRKGKAVGRFTAHLQVKDPEQK